MYDEGVRAGVTSMRLSGSRLMVARLTGGVDMLRIELANPSSHPVQEPLHTFKPGQTI